MTTGPRGSTEMLATAGAALGSTDVAFVPRPPYQPTRHGKKGFGRDLIASIRRVLDEATSAPGVRLPRRSGYPY